ncbi:hypothetical protein, partial [Ferrovum sp.]|uniref:hypothetical protein n=1 Tax=Ferrovum sp. TaxID=2609467 RepID=UPI00260C6B6A
QQPRKSAFMSSVFCIYRKFIAWMDALEIGKSPRMSKVQLISLTVEYFTGEILDPDRHYANYN